MDELAVWVELHARSDPRPATLENYRDWARQAAETAWFTASLDGEDAATGIVLVGWHEPPGVARAELDVMPERRHHGLGSALLAALGGWARERGYTELLGPVAEDDPGSLAWAERRGLARGMYEVAREAYPDVPGEGEEMAVFEDWLSVDMQGSGDRPEATFIALAGDEVVGYAKFSLGDARPTVAFHDMTGVKRSWRGRGVAGALKRAEIAWAKNNGYTRLETFNEERNEPIRRLNERHGYHPTPGQIILRGPIAPE
jgi:GNAT superfamily N-acetyltransferase